MWQSSLAFVRLESCTSVGVSIRILAPRPKVGIRILPLRAKVGFRVLAPEAEVGLNRLSIGHQSVNKL